MTTTLSVRDWYTPVDLTPASFTDAQTSNYTNPTPPNEPPPTIEKPPPSPSPSPQLIDKLLPLIGAINNGGLDITSVLDLLDKSGQGFGALGKLLPIIGPLMQNGNLGNLFGKKKKSMEETIDYNTINLD